MRFTFIHAADLHIDSPLAALGAKDPDVAAKFAAAGRAAVRKLIDETLDGGAKFLLIAGDVFDDDWKDVATGLFLTRELGRLHRAGVPTFLIRGNHDAEGKMTRDLPWGESVRWFESRHAHTRLLDDLKVAIHGRSFPERAVPPDFVAGYPRPCDGWLNIGLLHTSLEGFAEHKPYAPCTPADLAGFGYDYWALGHIHDARVVAREPWIVYPGNIQGRSPRECGPKGAVRVTVEDGRILAVEPVALDGARWAHERVDLAGLEEDEAIAEALAAALAQAHRGADGRPLALRLTLTGVTPAHARLAERLADVAGLWRAEAQALAHRLADDFWIEKIRLETRPPALAAAPDALDLAALLDAAAADPDFLAEVEKLAAGLKVKAPLGALDEMLTAPPEHWAARARELLIGARA